MNTRRKQKNDTWSQCIKKEMSLDFNLIKKKCHIIKEKRYGKNTIY